MSAINPGLPDEVFYPRPEDAGIVREAKERDEERERDLALARGMVEEIQEQVELVLKGSNYEGVSSEQIAGSIKEAVRVLVNSLESVIGKYDGGTASDSIFAVERETVKDLLREHGVSYYDLVAKEQN